MLVLLALLTTACVSEDPDATPVRATLDDGQMLLGSVQTETLRLVSGMGTLEIPLEDVGEVLPVEGGALGGSGGYVSVWLRNGSELHGRWAEPELRLGLSMGGGVVPVDLPMDRLERFQLQGGDEMSAGIVYRVHTIYGDDFVVDPVTTRIALDNELGTFAPFLGEVASLEPLDDGEDVWRMQLISGTVLVGGLAEDAVRLSLLMGPGEVAVPVEDIGRIERQDWGDYRRFAAEQAGAASPRPSRPADTAGDASQGSGSGAWFSNERQQAFKDSR